MNVGVLKRQSIINNIRTFTVYNSLTELQHQINICLKVLQNITVATTSKRNNHKRTQKSIESLCKSKLKSINII